MKYHIGWFYLPVNQVKSKRKVKEYYISRGSEIIAGDFRGYKEAKDYLRTLRKPTR